MKLTFR